MIAKRKELTKPPGDLLDRKNLFSRITTRAVDNLFKFHTFDETKIAKIAEAMPEINRATRSFGKQNTQTMSRLMTLTMLADSSPFRVIRQCLAQIENRRSAIKENRFKLLKDKITLEKKKKELEKDLDKFDRKLKEIEVEELTSKIADTALYIEGALKEIGLYQSTYKQICKSKGIPENWDEEDVEKAEVEHHLRMAFLHGYRDILSHGSLGMGTLEYFQQFGVHPQVAKAIIEGYIISIKRENLSKKVDYDSLEDFLDKAVDLFKSEYKKVLKRLGLNSLYETWCLYKEVKE